MERLCQILSDIAHQHLGIATLENRNRDSLDFHEVSVWQIKTALEAAYQAGKATPRDSTTVPGLPARFDKYEIHGGREFDDGGGKYCEQVPDDQAEFWSLYGHIPGQGVDAIGDFSTREHAEEIFARITGRSYG